MIDDALTHYERMTSGLGAKYVGWSEFAKAKALLQRAREEKITDPRDMAQFIREHSLNGLLILSMARQAVSEAIDAHGYDNRAVGLDPAVQAIIGIIHEVNGVGAASFLYQCTFQMLLHEREGKKVYTLSAELADRLRHTEVRGLDGGDLKLPFPSIYVCIPESMGFLLNDGMRDFPAIGAYITEDPNIEGCPGWRVLIAGKPRTDPRLPVGALDDETMFYTVLLPAGKSLDECLELSEVKHSESKTTIIHRNSHLWKETFMFLMNVVLYITNAEPMAKEQITDTAARHLSERIKRTDRAKKREELKERLRNMQLKRRIILGEHLPPQTKHGEGTPHTVLTRVSGHWRRQAHGKGWSERKLIWIEPFWRGDEDAPIRAPERYEVK